MEFEQLRQLIAVSEAGTMSGAAMATHITQPSLSRSMRRLEEELDCELFDRTRNSATLNDAGRVAVEHARDILAAEQRLHDALDDLARKKRTLRVAAVAPAPVWNLTARIVERFPGTILAPEILADAEVERCLFDRTADFAITRRPLVMPNCECMPFMTENLFVSVPEGNPLAKRAHVSFADLAGETFLVMDAIGFWRDVYERAIPDVHSIVQRDREVFTQLVDSSDIPCFTTDAPQNSNHANGRVEVPLSDADAHVTFYLVALKSAPARVCEIIDWVKKTSG
ncbi:MAG: LysR family transcriptional regulator [Eggerthellaceae bacterium]|nr:LysR family transcriptional regulator [Eggerthellaceae bacterium]